MAREVLAWLCYAYIRNVMHKPLYSNCEIWQHNWMTHRAYHMRYVATCVGLLLALAIVASFDDALGGQLWKVLTVASLAFTGTFLFNRLQRDREGFRHQKRELERAPSEPEARVSNVIYLATLALGVMCVGVAVLAPENLPRVVWVVPVLAGAAGIHLQAVT